MRVLIFRLLLASLCLGPASALPARDLREARFVERAREGFAHIFNQDYAPARDLFLALEREYPAHPAPPLYLASIRWMEEMARRQDLTLHRFVSASHFAAKTDLVMPEGERAAFLGEISRSENLAAAILEPSPGDRDARYYLATAAGLRASFAITIDHSLREAFRSGRKAYGLARGLIGEDPAYYDAYLITGVYEYIAGSVPWYVKWMTVVIGLGGDRELGMEHVRLASEKGTVARDEASLIRMILEVREKRYAEGLKIARALHGKFPRSFLLALSVAQIEQLAGMREEAARTFVRIERQVEQGRPNFDRIPLGEFRFHLATQLMHMERHDLAAERFRLCLADPLTGTEEKALSHLSLGKIHLWLHRPAAAERELRAVLSLPETEDSHGQARRLLRRLGRD